MAEASPRLMKPAIAAAATGLVLAVLAGFGGVIAAVAGGLAQPAFALAWSWRRGTRVAGDWRRDALALGVLWFGGLALVALLVAWPLAALRDSGSLGAAIGLSVVSGVCLLGLWRTWPLWHALERDGGDWRVHSRSLGEVEIGTWRGLGVAVLIAAVLTVLLLLAWPQLLAPNTRWLVAGALAVLSPLAHWLLQRTAAPSPLPFDDALLDDEFDAEPATLDTIDDLEAALYAAAGSGRIDQALALLDAGADAHALPPAGSRDQRTLPMLAAILPDLRLLRALIGRGVDLNAAHAGMAPLLAATRDSWHGRPEAVMTLLANGADPRATDADGNTPLHHAARSSDPGVAALLRDAAAELDARNHDGVTPLGIACACGNWRLARFLLERGAKTELADASPALLAAAGGEEDDVAGVQLLLKHKAKVDARDRHGRSALHEAARAGHAEIVGTLLAAGADVQASDGEGRTPWLDAARGGHLQVIERLLPARPDLHVADGEGRTALALACSAEQIDPALVQRLLEFGVDPSRAGHDGKRAVDLAAAAGRWSVVSLLDPAYPLPTTVADGDAASIGAGGNDRAPATLVREGLADDRYGELEALAQLLSPRELGALLHEPTIAHHAIRIDWLLAHGADADARDRIEQDTALFALMS